MGWWIREEDERCRQGQESIQKFKEAGRLCASPIRDGLITLGILINLGASPLDSLWE